MKRLLLLGSLLLAACGGSVSPNDSGSGNDAQNPADTGNGGTDAGGAMDAGNGGTDAGSGVDVQTPTDTGSGSTDAGGGRDVVPIDAGPPTPYTVEMPAVPLQPGDETTMCSTFRLGNTEAGLITHIHVHLAPGSHHLIFYRSADTQEDPGPTPCNGLGGILNGSAPLIIAQATDSDLNMPVNVGMAIGPNQMIKIEEHFINLTGAPIQGTGTVNVDVVSANSGLTPADMIFWGSTNINVPPHSTGSADFFRGVRNNVHIFGLTTHTHQMGTHATLERTTNASIPGDLLYQNDNWAEPPLQQYDPTLDFAGHDGIHLHCEYNNTTSQTLTFGESATDEMCFFWAFYFPSYGFDVCLGSNCGIF